MSNVHSGSQALSSSSFSTIICGPHSLMLFSHEMGTTFINPMIPIRELGEKIIINLTKITRLSVGALC